MLHKIRPNAFDLASFFHHHITDVIHYKCVIAQTTNQGILTQAAHQHIVAGPAIKTALAARPARIKEELDTAAAARSTAEKSFADVKAALADSDKEAARILEEARETASKVGADIVARAHTDAAAIKERGQVEIQSARRQAQADLTAEVSRLALGAAEKVIESNLSEATQQALVESYISQVGAAN